MKKRRALRKVGKTVTIRVSLRFYRFLERYARAHSISLTQASEEIVKLFEKALKKEKDDFLDRLNSLI